MVAGGPVSWECKRQDTVALSTVEVEFMVFSKATTQALWLLKYFNEVGLSVIRLLKIFADNSSSISNSLNDKNYWYMKHMYMDVWHHFIKEHTKLGNIIFQYTPTTENVADILTKTLPKDTLHKFVYQMGLNQRTTSMSVQGECWSGLIHFRFHFFSFVLQRYYLVISETCYTETLLGHIWHAYQERAERERSDPEWNGITPE